MPIVITQPTTTERLSEHFSHSKIADISHKKVSRHLRPLQRSWDFDPNTKMMGVYFPPNQCLPEQIEEKLEDLMAPFLRKYSTFRPQILNLKKIGITEIEGIENLRIMVDFRGDKRESWSSFLVPNIAQINMIENTDDNYFSRPTHITALGFCLPGAFIKEAVSSPGLIINHLRSEDHKIDITPNNLIDLQRNLSIIVRTGDNTDGLPVLTLVTLKNLRVLEEGNNNPEYDIKSKTGRLNVFHKFIRETPNVLLFKSFRPSA